jgi:hypothetical protein
MRPKETKLTVQIGLISFRRSYSTTLITVVKRAQHKLGANDSGDKG